jgi:hypothetical protein
MSPIRRNPPKDPPSEPTGDDLVELARALDALMRQPPRPWPSIFVVGDDAVSAITLPRRGDEAG